MQCELHPDVETNLRCGRCGRPICPRCLVQTPVGARCPQCAAVRRLPVFQVGLRHYVVALAVGLGVAVGFSFLWRLLWSAIAPTFGILSLLLFVAMGYAVGELISLSVNRKRGPWLQAIAAVSTLVGFGLALSFYVFLSLSLYGLIALGAAVYIAVSRLR